MKKTILLLFVATITSFSFQTPPENKALELNWIPDFNEALKQAKEENKVLLIWFTGSDWCGYCKVLKQDFFDTDKFKEIAEKDLVLYKADFPNNPKLVTQVQLLKNYQLKYKYHVRGYPTVILLNGKGQELDRVSGYGEYYTQSAPSHFRMLEKTLKSKAN